MGLPDNIQQLELIRADCRQLVRQRAGLSAGAALIPVPGIDLVADMALFARLLEQISQRFGLSQSDLAKLPAARRRYVMLAATRVGSELIGRYVHRKLASWLLRKLGSRLLGRSPLKLVPFAGHAVAASLSYRVAIQLGDDHIDACYRVAQQCLDYPSTHKDHR